MQKTIGVITILLGMGIFFRATAWAESFSISGNGAGTVNSINIRSDSQTTVSQGNSGSVTNDTQSNPDTGGNSASGNNGGANVSTGNQSSTTNIDNNFNSNSADPGCCGAGSPKPTATVRPSVKPTPTPPPGDGDGGQGGSSGGSGSSGNGGSGGGGVSGGQVLGLSATAGPENERYVFYVLGSLCLLAGVVLLAGPRKLFV